jgi:hypothetical protein
VNIKPVPLRCPYCGQRLRVEYTYEGPSYMQEQVVGGFECSEGWECGATWDRAGEPMNLPYVTPEEK